MKMTTLLFPLLGACCLGGVGYFLFGGSLLLWGLVAWIATIPALFIYVSLRSKDALTGLRDMRWMRD